MGGKYTSQLTNINTFLVCRHPSTAVSGGGETTTNGKAQNSENDHNQKEEQPQSKDKPDSNSKWRWIEDVSGESEDKRRTAGDG